MVKYLHCLRTFNKIVWNIQGFNSPAIFSLKLKQMKQFKDLQFKQHRELNGVVARITFDNGYGASVVKHEFSYGGKDGLYELAVLDADGELTYDTPITSDVIGYLREVDVTDVMEKIQQL
jgi:hypothetical protein